MGQSRGYGPLALALAATVPPILLQVITHVWRSMVANVVNEPYLDEVFHVRQAQVYCAGNLTHWDPKITTPPGLYLVSWLLHLAGISCDMWSLRNLNSFVLFLACYPLAAAFRILAQAVKNPTGMDRVSALEIRTALQNTHTAVNICMFPPLFFFSALYYTDVASTAFVMLSYMLCAREQYPFKSLYGLMTRVAIVVSGIASLFFRQTNIFWVAVLPAGLAVVDCIKSNTKRKRQPRPQNDLSFYEVIVDSWNGVLLYDAPLSKASFQDYIKTVISIGVSALAHSQVVIMALVPYGIILASFAAFIVWNGGVVLGDKANHVATIHLPQMLYLWPYMTFFSIPLQLPYILSFLPKMLLPSFIRSFSPTPTNLSATLSILTLSCAVALTAIHWNTIVHPFTLADNRHYTFYVFRLLVLRNPLLKYLAAPIYVLCAWAAMLTLAGPARQEKTDTAETMDALLTTTCKSQEAIATLPASNSLKEQRVTVGFFLVYLLTCTLCLVTAPLVEPRYFILPWLTWRLYVPSPVPLPPSNPGGEAQKEETLWRTYDYRLVLETAWFLAINAVTGYLFLFRGFSWPQEPGKVQRFMW